MNQLLLLMKSQYRRAACTALALLAGSVSLTVAGEDSPRDWYEKGRLAYFQNRFDIAKPYFLKVLKVAPDHGPTQAMLASIRTAEARAGVDSTTLGWATRLNLPQIDVEDATIGEVIKFLRVKSRELSKGAWEPNFLLRLPEGTDAPRVSISLRNVPVKYVVEALAEMSGLKVRYDEHAITLAPADLLPPEPDPADLAAKAKSGRPLLGETTKKEE